MNETMLIWATLVLVVFTLVVLERRSKKEKKVLREQCLSLKGELRVYERAAMHDLGGVETRDLHDLVYYHDRSEEDKFGEIWRRASGKVKQAFQEYKERDEPILLLHR